MLCYFHFHWVHSLFFFETSFLSHGLFISVLLNFRMFQDFPIVYFFIFISFIIREHILYDFISFQFVEVCFKAQEIAYIGEFSKDFSAVFGCSVYVSEVLLVDCVVEIACIAHVKICLFLRSPVSVIPCIWVSVWHTDI